MYKSNIIKIVYKESGNSFSHWHSNAYYPYGLPTSETSIIIGDDHRYGGKEFDLRNGLNTYDFGARTYVPDECRFWQPDPKAHDYHWLSPYAYCGGGVGLICGIYR